MQKLDLDTILKFGITALATISGILLSIIVFFIKRFMDDVKKEQNENKEEIKEIIEEIKIIHKEYEDIYERVITLEVLCRERRCKK